MKKILSLKSVTMIVLSFIIMGISLSVFATDSVLDSGNTSTEPINVSQNEYDNAGTIPTDPNYVTNNATSNTTTNISNGINTSSAYNTVDEDKTDLPQTGIEDYNIGILLIICVAASIYTYKKMKDYKNV